MFVCCGLYEYLRTGTFLLELQIVAQSCIACRHVHSARKTCFKLYKQEILQCLVPSILSFQSCSFSVSGQILASPLGWLLLLASEYCDDSYAMNVSL